MVAAILPTGVDGIETPWFCLVLEMITVWPSNKTTVVTVRNDLKFEKILSNLVNSRNKDYLKISKSYDLFREDVIDALMVRGKSLTYRSHLYHVLRGAKPRDQSVNQVNR
jgi:hypothetical protein